MLGSKAGRCCELIWEDEHNTFITGCFNSMNGKILLVEDDTGFGTMLRKWFERNDFSVQWCTHLNSAQEALSRGEYDVVLSDLRLPDGDGIMLLQWMKEHKMNTPVIILTGYGEVQTAVAAIKLGAYDFLEKPVNPSVLQQKIESIFRQRKEGTYAVKEAHKITENDTEATKTVLTPSFVKGESPLLQKMYEYIALVAPTQMSVMILGESGTGKEHVARMIHEQSSRASKPFVAVDCGSLSMELAPSELFGHKKGAFTSAVEDKTGFFLEADGGTLFLDEVGNLPYGVQMQMLRALQEKKIRPVGAMADVDVDVRIVAATNKNLEKAIVAGKFREDLYHRLNEFLIEVPPLRDCLEDIPLYAAHFLKEANIELDRHIQSISPEALHELENYSWPGNLRELRNVIRRTVLFTKGDTITVENLPTLKEKSENDTKKDIALTRDADEEKERIIRALEKAGGNKTLAARLLKIDRKTLYNKIHLYNLDL
jgi:two-component system response regulator HydG